MAEAPDRERSTLTPVLLVVGALALGGLLMVALVCVGSVAGLVSLGNSLDRSFEQVADEISAPR